jgi:hypothetical protein
MSSDSSDSASPAMAHDSEKHDRTSSASQPPRRKQVRIVESINSLREYLYQFWSIFPSNSCANTGLFKVKLACTNCRKAHAACDDVRPCSRCAKYNLADSCEDKPRRKRTAASVASGKRSFEEFSASSALAGAKSDLLTPRTLLYNLCYGLRIGISRGRVWRHYFRYRFFFRTPTGIASARVSDKLYQRAPLFHRFV